MVVVVVVVVENLLIILFLVCLKMAVLSNHIYSRLTLTVLWGAP